MAWIGIRRLLNRIVPAQGKNAKPLDAPVPRRAASTPMKRVPHNRIATVLNRAGNSHARTLASLRRITAGKRGTEPDFTFLARDTASPYVDNRPLLAAGKPELRVYKAVYVQSDEEIGLFSDEVVVNCAP